MEVKKILNKGNKNIKKRWWVVVPIFLFVLVIGGNSLVKKAGCIWLNNQSTYFSANVFYHEGLKPTCISLEEYDQEYLNGELFQCLSSREDFSDPFNCEKKIIVGYYNGS